MKKSHYSRQSLVKLMLSKNGETNEVRCKVDKEELIKQRKNYTYNSNSDKNPKPRNWNNKKEMKKYKKNRISK